MILYLPQPLHFVSPQQESIPVTLSQHNDTPMGGTSPSTTLGNYFARYRITLYLVFAAAASLSVAWNWNWLTGAGVFRIMASLPCTLTMLMCMKRCTQGN